MGFETFIAMRHLTRRRKTGFISLISMISVSGVAIGVMALIVVLAVMSGFDRELKAKIVGVQPHLRIEKVDGIENVDRDIAMIRQHNIPGIVSLAPFVEGQAILRSTKNASGVLVKGIDAASEDLSLFQKSLVSGTLNFSDSVQVERKRFLLFFKKKIETRQGSIIIGENLAASLNAQVGDVINLITPIPEPENPFVPLPMHVRTWSFLVRGIYRVGMNDFDSTLALVNIEQAQKVYQMGTKVTGISMRFQNVDDAEKWKWVIAGDFSSQYFFRSWYDMNQNFFQALKVEKSVMTILGADHSRCGFQHHFDFDHGGDGKDKGYRHTPGARRDAHEYPQDLCHGGVQHRLARYHAWGGDGAFACLQFEPRGGFSQENHGIGCFSKRYLSF